MRLSKSRFTLGLQCYRRLWWQVHEPEALELRADAMQQAIKVVRPAFDAFYATLNDEQKARINTGGPRRWGWHGWWRSG